MPTPEENQQARDFLRDNLDPNLEGIEASVRNALADAYIAGKLVAADSLSTTVAQVLSSDDPESYWDNWKPGNIEASQLLSDGGFQKLLKDAGKIIRGIADTSLDQMGTILSQGAARGNSVDQIANAMQSVLGNPTRAYIIANTELNRAVSESSLQAFDEMGLSQWEWLVSDGACPECQAMADTGPFDVGGSADQPPLHPGCRCAVSPVGSFSQSNVDSSEEQTLD